MLVVALSGVSPPSLASASAATSPRPLHPGHVVFDVGVHSKVTSAQALAAASSSSTFPQFTAHVKVGPASYPYVMAGKNPAVKHVNPAATVKAKLIPVIIKVGTVDTWDPTKIDSCDSGASPLTRVQQSPAVTSQAWTLGGTPVGTGQATDAYQRADFWKYAQPLAASTPSSAQ